MKKNDFPEPLDDTALADTWASAWAELGRPVPLALRLELQTAWTEAHRRYHDLRHLRECMALWLLWKGECERPGEVAMALWFHDAIHDPKESGNELRSASWAARARFERYDQDIRKEYAWVPGFRYRHQRAHVLKGFLNRVPHYLSASARELLEQQARLNLGAAISRLEQ